MTAPLASVAGDVAKVYGDAIFSPRVDGVLDPVTAAMKILAARPEIIPTLPAYRVPDFAAFAPLAQLVGRDAQSRLDAVAALEFHRGAISDAISAGALITLATAVELTTIAAGLGPSVAAAVVAATPAGPAAQMAAAAGLIAIAFGQAQQALEEMRTGLEEAAQRLAAATAQAMAVPLPGATVGTQEAEAALGGYAAQTVLGTPPAPMASAPPQVRPVAPPVRATRPAAAPPVREAPAPPAPAAVPAAAPNPSAAAAAAVAAAKSQLGTPYVWGGSQPGGFDCSGLTSWAYRQAGVTIPRIASDQAVGRQVSFAELQPGDLVIWSGHAAMYVGDGMMIEAGDPVQLNPVRTSNMGMAFKGFWRPTA